MSMSELFRLKSEGGVEVVFWNPEDKTYGKYKLSFEPHEDDCIFNSELFETVLIDEVLRLRALVTTLSEATRSEIVQDQKEHIGELNERIAALERDNKMLCDSILGEDAEYERGRAEGARRQREMLAEYYSAMNHGLRAVLASDVIAADLRAGRCPRAEGEKKRGLDHAIGW